MTLMVLGTVQDGGFPQAGCFKECCKSIDKTQKRLISSIAIINKETNDCWIIDITPDFKDQIKLIKDFLSIDTLPNIKGVFLTHAHIGHYIGLLDLGVEVMNMDSIPVYAMPKMKSFLENNAPFNFLIESGNIIINSIDNDNVVSLSDQVFIRPFLVPHRNELSETAGYNIKSNSKSIIYIPDIDAWSLWENNILDVIKENDLLFLDGTFYDSNELPDRDISKVPHPFVCESLKIFSDLNHADKQKILFTHLNHSNPLLNQNSLESKSLADKGFKILSEKQVFPI